MSKIRGMLICGLMVAVAVASGCKKSGGSTTEIEFKNFSDRTISVLHFSDLVYKIERMELKPARIISTETPRQEIPETFTITWNYKSGPNSSGAKRSKLSLHTIPKSQRTGKFVLEFTKEYQWIVRFEQSSR